MVRNYREGYGLFACNGMMFNHESPRRGETFVSRKITRAVSAILAGRQTKLFLGNLDARRDLGFAPEYVEGMWLMLQQEAPCDLVFGTGETHSVLEFVEEEPRYRRLTEVPLLQADPSEAKRRLGWEPTVTFRDLVRIMMDANLEAAGLPAPGQGKRRLTDGRLAWLRRP